MKIFGRAFTLTVLIFVACFGDNDVAEARTIMFQRLHRYRRTLPTVSKESDVGVLKRQATATPATTTPKPIITQQLPLAVPPAMILKRTVKTRHIKRRPTKVVATSSVAPLSSTPFLPIAHASTFPSTVLVAPPNLSTTTSRVPWMANSDAQQAGAVAHHLHHATVSTENDKAQVGASGNSFGIATQKQQQQQQKHQQHLHIRKQQHLLINQKQQSSSQQQQQEEEEEDKQHHQYAEGATEEAQKHQPLPPQIANDNRFYESYHPAAVYKPQIIEQYDRRDLDGQYEFSYTLSNGEVRYERAYWLPVGNTKVLARKGFYSHPLPNHRFRTVFYTADYLGYREDRSSITRLRPELPQTLEVDEPTKAEAKSIDASIAVTSESTPNNNANGPAIKQETISKQ